MRVEVAGVVVWRAYRIGNEGRKEEKVFVAIVGAVDEQSIQGGLVLLHRGIVSTP